MYEKEIEVMMECVKFADNVIAICGSFSLPDVYIRKTIIDELYDSGKYPNLKQEWDKEVGNFS